MPTKAELEVQLAEANAKIETMGAGVVVADVQGDELLEGELYHASDAGLTHVEGPYAAEGKAATLTEDGEYHVVATKEDGLSLKDRVVAMVGVEAWNLAVMLAAGEADMIAIPLSADSPFLTINGLEGDEEEDAILHVMLREPDTTEVEADLKRVTMERDDARHKLGLMQQEKQALHGSIDSLKSVV